MEDGLRRRFVLLMSVLIFVSVSSFAIVEGGGSQNLNASSDASTAVTLSDGFTLSTTGSWTTGGYTIVVIVPNNGGSPYKNYTISFTGTLITAPADPSYGKFNVNSGEVESGTGSGSKTLTYTANDGATRVQIGTDLSGITYSGDGTVTITVTDEGASSASATQDYVEGSIGNNVYVSTIGGGPKHYTSLSDAYNNTSGTDPTIRLLTDVIQNDTLEIKKDLTITSDSSSQVCSIKHSDDSSKTILKVTNGTVVLKYITIDGNKQGSDFLVIVGSVDGTSPPTLTLDSGSTVKDGAAGGILLGLTTGFLVKSYGSLYIQSGAVIEGNAGGCFAYQVALKCWVGGIGVTGNTTFVMNGGEIKNNNGAHAGGVAFCGNKDGSAEMNGGSITRNKSSDGPGAILVSYHGRLCLNGGTMTENKSGRDVGAVTVVKSLNVPYWFNIGGFAGGEGAPLQIYENYDAVGAEKNLLLHTYVVADRVSDDLTLAESSMIGVSVESWPSEKVSDVNVVGGSTKAEASYFKSDDLVIAGMIREEGTGVMKLSYKDRGQDIVYVSSEASGGNDVSGNGTVGRPFKTLARAYELVRDNGTIYLKSDIDAGNADKESYITVESKNITITSVKESTFKVTCTSDTNLIYIKSGSVTLEEVTLTDKDGQNGKRQAPLVFVAPKDGKATEVCATLNLAEGSTVKDITMAKNEGSYGGGVIVVYPGGKLTMENDATIQNCTAVAGPVYCINGTFEMSGGTISGCTSYRADGGAAVRLSKMSTMTMSGGTISGCGSATSGCAGTVYMDYGGNNTFKMSGGSITGNTATFGGGVFVDRSVLPNNIEVSGTAKISGNKNASDGWSNIYLVDGQDLRPYIVISGAMSDGADVGVYTASDLTNDVKVAEFADGVTTEGYANHIHSDKPAVAGLKLDGNKLYLSSEASTALVKFGSLPQWMESIGGSLTQNIAGTGGTTTAIDPIGLVSNSRYAEVTEKQASAIREALKDKGLDVVLIYGVIVIYGTPTIQVDVNLETILKDLEPAVAQATLKDSDGSTVGGYATVVDALNAAMSGQTVVISIREGTELTPVVKGTLSQGVILEISSRTYRADDGNATIDVDKDGNVTLSNGKLEVADGAVSVPMGSGSTGLKVNGESYSITAGSQSATLTVPNGKTATADDGVSYSDGTFLISRSGSGDDQKTSVKGSGSGTITSKQDASGNANTIIIVDSGTEVSIAADGSMKLVGGKGSSTGTMTASIVKLGEMSFSGTAKYTVDTEQSTLTTDESGTVTVESVEFTGAAGKTFTLGKEGEGSSAVYTIIAPNGTKFRSGKMMVIGDGGYIKAEIGSDGTLTIAEGAGAVAGTVFLRIDDSRIQVRTDDLIMVNISDGKPTVGIPSGIKATIGSTEYEAAADGAEILINGGNDVLMKGAVRIGQDKTMTINGGPVVTNRGTGNVTVSIEGGGSAVSIPQNGKVRIGDDEYEASDTGASFAVDKSGIILLVDGSVKCGDSTISGSTGNEVLIRGTKVLEKGASVLGLNGNAIKNSSASDGISITVQVDWTAKTNTVTAPKDGVAEIDSAWYVSAQDGTKILIDGSGMTLIEGAMKIPEGKEVSIGTNGPKVENKGDADVTVSIKEEGSAVEISQGGKAKIGGKEISSGSSNSVTVDVDGSGNLSVTMSSGDKVDIGGAGYEATEADTKICVRDGTNTLEKGSVKIDQGDSITIKDGPVVINEGTGDVTASVKGDGCSVKISSDGKAKIGDSEVSAGADSEITVGIGEEGKLEVEIPSENKATIGGTEYEAAADSTKILIDEKENVLESGAVKIGKDKEISVGDSKTVVKGLEDEDAKKVTVTAEEGGSGSVRIPAGGKAKIGIASIEATGTEITVEIGKDGKISMTIDPGNTVDIGGNAYTGSFPRGSKISIDPDTGVVTVYDMRKIVIDTGIGYSFDMECGKGETIALPTGREPGHVIERDGYVLVGWRSADSQSNTKDYGLGSDYTVGEDESLKAIWVENEDVVVYYTDNGGSIVGSTYAALDDGIASLDSTVTKDGYAFLGWTATDAAGNKVAYASGLTLKASGTTYMAAYLVADSELSGLCTVKYDSGYGGGIAFKQYAGSGIYVSLPTARDMHRDGYTFLGWEVAGTSTAIMAVSLGAEMGERVSGTYLVSDDVTFTAVWAADGSDEKPWWDDDDDPYIPYHPSTGGSSDGSMDTVLIVVVASVAVLLLQLMVLSSRRRS